MVAADATSVVTMMRPLMDFWSTLRGLLRVTVSRVTPHMKGTELSACKIMMKRILGFEISLAKVLRTTLKSLSCLVVSSPSRSPFRLRLFLGQVWSHTGVGASGTFSAPPYFGTTNRSAFLTNVKCN